MKIVLCLRRGRSGDVSPFEASAYEQALRLKEGEIMLLSMAPESDGETLQSLSRLGAKKTVLLTDPAFSGSDTLATAYTLSLAIRRLAPDLVFCGRQTLEGDTAQTPQMLAAMLEIPVVSGIYELRDEGGALSAETTEGSKVLPPKCLCIFERGCDLRLPRLGSAIAPTERWDAAAIGADKEKCGLSGSPTRVVSTEENRSGLRKCTFLPPSEFLRTAQQALLSAVSEDHPAHGEKKLSLAYVTDERLREIAESVASRVLFFSPDDPKSMADRIAADHPDAVLWGCSAKEKQSAANVAARLRLGLCADCVRLRTDGKSLFMIRPALSGTVMATVRSETVPAMATVRTKSDASDAVVTVGYGAKDALPAVRRIAENLHAELGASRKIVDNGLAPHQWQIGLTGRTVAPRLYIAIGVSGAVHHLVGMERSGVILAVNPDPDAQIFRYADYGFVCTAEELADSL